MTRSRRDSAPAHPDFAFNMRELAGSLGDFGTLFPLAVGYIAINGLDPAGLFIMLGLTNVALGLIYRLPMPLQPKKVIASVAIAQRWSPPLIYASGLGLGIFWFLLVLTGLLRRIVAITPVFIVRGIQLALGVMLAWRAVELMAPAPLLGVLAVAIVLLLRENRYAPAAVVLVALGVALMAWRGDLANVAPPALSLPPLTLPRPADIWQAMLLAGFAQIPLSITNAVSATGALIRDYFPERAVSERKLMLNMGAMNVAAALFGGMPMCHGAGGLASQYYFGARTGGTPMLEGLIEVGIGLLLSGSISSLMAAFPMPLIGGMMVLVGIQLGKGAIALRGRALALCLVTAALSVATNMAVGYLVGLGLTYAIRALAGPKDGALPANGRDEADDSVGTPASNETPADGTNMKGDGAQ